MFNGLLLVPLFHPKTPCWPLDGDDSWISTSSPLYFYCILKESLVLTSRDIITLLTVLLNSDPLPSGYHLVKGVPIHMGFLRAIPHSLPPSWLKHLCHMSNPKVTVSSIPFILPPAARPFARHSLHHESQLAKMHTTTVCWCMERPPLWCLQNEAYSP